MPTISEALALASRHHQAGQLPAASEIYRRILTVEPDNADALHQLGVLYHQTGQLDAAAELIGRAIAQAPDRAEFYHNRGEALRMLGRRDEAIASLRRAVELKPDFAGACNNLGVALQEDGRIDEAVVWHRRALEIEPNDARTHNSLGVALLEQGRLDEAIACCQRALELQPNYAEAYSNLGNGLRFHGRLADAVQCYVQSLRLRPNQAMTHSNLGVALQQQGRLDDAVACYQQALALSPRYAKAHNNLGSALHAAGMLDDAVAAYQTALEVRPDYAEAHNNLGHALKDLAQLPAAIAAFRRAIQLQPQQPQFGSSLAFSLSFCPGYDVRAVGDEARRWGRQHAEPLASSITPALNDRSPDRRLKVGYVSPDFRRHCQALFTTPLFRAHEHANFEIHCYSDAAWPDDITADLRGKVDVWRDTAGLSAEQLAEMIRNDRIDILVDLTMHMAGNRLLTFARKPAPVQVCWLAYPGTTGVSAIDYRLTDPYLDPEGLDDHCYSEQTIRLPETFWCYDPLASEPAVNPLPAGGGKPITFGCLNNFCKLHEGVLQLWARVLKAVPNSRLVLLAPEGQSRALVQQRLAAAGIAAERVSFVAHQLRPQYLEVYHRIDIGLDTFPSNGHTTSLDAYWMGVPVVTLAGGTAVGRAGVSQLTNLGLTELIAHSPEQYVEIAAKLAGDLPRLTELRATLRSRLEQSPLMDAPRFARNMEAAYRRMWRRWCEGGQ